MKPIINHCSTNKTIVLKKTSIKSKYYLKIWSFNKQLNLISTNKITVEILKENYKKYNKVYSTLICSNLNLLTCQVL